MHEAGHAVVATLIGCMEVIGVSIGDRDGLTQIVEVDGSTSPEHCNDVMVMLMAGRAAEGLVLGSPSAGAGGDQISNMAKLAKEEMGVETFEVLADRGYFSGEEILACEALGAILRS